MSGFLLFAQLLISGIALGAMYALIALGFVTIYRATNVFNFAHGEFVTFGAYMMVACLTAGLPWIVALGVTMVATGALAGVIERTFLRKLVGRPIFVTIILTIFVGFLIRIFSALLFGTETTGVDTPWDRTGAVELFGASILYNSIAAIIATSIILAIFFVVTRYSRMGVAMRATAIDQETSLALGIPVGRIFGMTWITAGILAAIGGVFLGMFPRTVDPNLGFVALRAFPAVIVGGLESPSGAVVAGISLGVLEVLSQAYINNALGDFGRGFHEVLPYLVMIAFLVIRPHGLFGQKEVERV